jgi:hypothetical protein
VVLVGYNPSMPAKGAYPPAPVIASDLDGIHSIEDAARSTGGQMRDTMGLFSRRDPVRAFTRRGCYGVTQ